MMSVFEVGEVDADDVTSAMNDDMEFAISVLRAIAENVSVNDLDDPVVDFLTAEKRQELADYYLSLGRTLKG